MINTYALTGPRKTHPQVGQYVFPIFHCKGVGCVYISSENAFDKSALLVDRNKLKIQVKTNSSTNYYYYYYYLYCYILLLLLLLLPLLLLLELQEATRMHFSGPKICICARAQHRSLKRHQGHHNAFKFQYFHKCIFWFGKKASSQAGMENQCA